MDPIDESAGRRVDPGRAPPPRSRALVLLALVLAVPVIGAANPIDLLWCAGWYDDADADQLVAKSMSPEGGVGPTALTPVCLHPCAVLVAGAVGWTRPEVHGSIGARGPPAAAVVPMLAALRLPCPPHSPCVRLVLERSPPRPGRRSPVHIDE